MHLPVLLGGKLLLPLVTLLMPTLTAGLKKVLGTDSIEHDGIRQGIHGLIPVATSVLTVFALCHLGIPIAGVDMPAHDSATCLTVGLMVGTSATWIRDQYKSWGDLARTLLEKIKE